MAQIFLSHSTKDRSFVEREIVQALHINGLRFWYSKLNILTAEQWQEAILRGLEDCEWFMVVMSPRAVASRWVRAEVTWAFEHRAEGKIVPVLLEECNHWKLHMQIPLVQHVDFRADLSEARRRLVELVRPNGPHASAVRTTPDAVSLIRPPSVALAPPARRAEGSHPAPKPQAPRRRVEGKRVSPSRNRLGQVLVDLGYIDDDQLWELLQEVRKTNRRTGELAVERGMLRASQLYAALADQCGLDFFDLDEVEVDPAAINLVPKAFAYFHEILPVSFDAERDILTIAMAAPENVTTWDEVQNLLAVREVRGIVCEREKILAAIHRLYP